MFLLLILGYVQTRGYTDVEENPPVPLVIPSVKVEVPDDHVILISFKWLFMDIDCLNSVVLYVGGDQLKKRNVNALTTFLSVPLACHKKLQ